MTVENTKEADRLVVMSPSDRVAAPATNHRNDMLQWTPAERAIREAVLAVEATGADPLLTDAVNLLAHARQKVAMFVIENTPVGWLQVVPNMGPYEHVRAVASEDYPKAACPRCGVEQEDKDGFGVLHCEKCGYCRHPQIEPSGKCALCGAVLGPPKPPRPPGRAYA